MWSLLFNSFNFQGISKSALAVFKRNILVFNKNRSIEIFNFTFEPIILFSVLGLGLGFVLNQSLGVSYLQFLFPGFLCFTAFNISFIESSFGFIKRKEQKGYLQTIFLSPVQTKDIAYGEVFWAFAKAMVGVLVLFLALLILSSEQPQNVLETLLVSVVLAWSGAVLGLITSSLSKNNNQIILTYTIYALPLSMLCNVFFPAKYLNVYFKILSYLNPVAHGANMLHSSLTHSINHWFYIHAAILFAFLYLGTNLAISVFSHKFNLR